MVESVDQWPGTEWLDTPALQSLDCSTKSKLVAQQQWPSVNQYNELFPEAPLRFIEQDSSAVKQTGGYEIFIQQQQAIPTRTHNIHDFMNALSWQLYPQTKLALHHLQCSEHQTDNISQGNGRSPLQNACTLFDECGIILLSPHTEFIDAIREHRWLDLFWERREQLIVESKILILGHAILEKALNPYIGMCGNIIHLSMDLQTNRFQIDQQLATWIQSDFKRQNLHPFPALGYPGWHMDNENIGFYLNQQYFRPLINR